MTIPHLGEKRDDFVVTLQSRRSGLSIGQPGRDRKSLTLRRGCVREASLHALPRLSHGAGHKRRERSGEGNPHHSELVLGLEHAMYL
jgi:hypothetical protein